MYQLYRKEVADHIDSIRFLIILVMALFLAGVSLYSALGGLQSAIESSAVSRFIFLRIFVTDNGSVPSFASLVAWAGPLFGLIFGFDAINSERNSGTLNRLLAQPIYRDDVINGKFLAGITVISLIVISMTLLICGVGLFQIGIPPTGEEVMRILVFVVFTIIYIAFWLGLAILLSVVCRHVATSVLSVVAVWLVFALFFSLIAGGIAGALYPTAFLYYPDITMDTVAYFDFQQEFNRISPSFMYSEAIGTILDPSINAMDFLSLYERQLIGVPDSVLPLGQSLLMVWPHLVGIIAEMVAVFVIAYIVFMKQEIRGA